MFIPPQQTGVLGLPVHSMPRPAANVSNVANVPTPDAIKPPEAEFDKYKLSS